MGSHNIFIGAIGIALAGLAVLIGMSMFHSYKVNAEKDTIMNEMTEIAEVARQFYGRIPSQGGGHGSFLGFTVPVRLGNSPFAIYELTVNPQSIWITATSRQDPANTIQVMLQMTRAGQRERLKNWRFTGEYR